MAQELKKAYEKDKLVKKHIVELQNGLSPKSSFSLKHSLLFKNGRIYILDCSNLSWRYYILYMSTPMLVT